MKTTIGKTVKGGRRKMVFAVLAVVFLVLVASVLYLLPPSNGIIPQFYDPNGDILPNSISEKCYLEVDGAQLGMILRAKNTDDPVMLICGGGPGIPEYLLEDMYPSKLAEQFVVCYWDYRGTGLSFDANTNPQEMTTERYIADVIAVTKYLQERFEQEKIYIMGHSFGTYLAVKVLQRAPQYYTAYIAMSQICDRRKSEYEAYDYMKGQYELAVNTEAAKQFEKYPIHESEEAYHSYCFSSLRDNSMHELGVGSTRDMHSVITGLFFPSLRCTAYTPKERINLWRGKIASHQFIVTADTEKYNAFSEAQVLDVPVYFFAGAYDYTCCYSLQKKYYEQLTAPIKEFYTFEASAHSPIFEEPDKAQTILNKIIMDNAVFN